MIVIANLFGLALSAFMWNASLQLSVAFCLTGGCEIVLSSPYAKIFGVPIAAWGVAYYAFATLLGVFRLIDDRPIHRLVSWPLGMGGILASAYFFYLELFKIHAICFWCKFSTVTTIVLLILTILDIRKRGGIAAVKADIMSLRA